MQSRKKPKSNVVSSKPLPMVGAQAALSAKIGGVSNASNPNHLPNSKKGK